MIYLQRNDYFYLCILYKIDSRISCYRNSEGKCENYTFFKTKYDNLSHIVDQLMIYRAPLGIGHAPGLLDIITTAIQKYFKNILKTAKKIV